jgi:hypothetical protein
MTLRLVKDGEPETDAEDVERIARITERLVGVTKADGVYWVVTAAGDDVNVAFFGGKLESAVLAEALAEEMKREAVGL